MKVIAQLVRHFWQRGALTSDEAAYLVRHGFVRARDLPGYQGPDLSVHQKKAGNPDSQGSMEPFSLSPPAGPPDGFDLVEEQLVRRSSRGVRSHRYRKKVLDEKDLCQRVEGELRRRRPWLRQLTKLASRVGPCDGWESAAAALRQLPPHRFSRELNALLQADAAVLPKLWQAIDVEPFHRLVRDDEIRGRAANAYAALLVASDPSALGKYSWMLKHEAMQGVINLRVMYRRLLFGLNRLYHRDRGLLARTLSGRCDPALFWALVLLHNANRAPGRSVSPAWEYGPVEQPEEEVWRKAWTIALNLDRPAAAKLLVACYADPAQRRGPTAGTCELPLYCPVGWHEPGGSEW
jgi:hypothetical protein